jgi:hypothetical protein
MRPRHGTERGGTAALVLLAIALVSAGCVGGATGPLHPPSGPGDERVVDSQRGAGGPAGEGGTGGDSRPTAHGVELPAHEFAEGTIGNVVAELTVNNTASVSRRVRVIAAIRVNGSLETASKEIPLEPGQETIVGIHFEADWEAFSGNLTWARVEDA